MSKRSKNQLPVFAAESGFRVIRHERRERAEQMVLCETLRPEFDQVTGALLGYRVLGADMRKVDSDVKSIRTRVLVNAADMELYAGHSATEGMSESRRQERVANGRAAEDRIERLHMAVDIIPYLREKRGDVLRVWPKR